MLDVKDLELIAGVVTKALEPVNQRLDVIEDKLVEVDSRLSNVETKLVEVDSRLSNVETKLVEVDSRLSNVEAKLAEVKERVSTLENTVVNMNSRLSEVESQVRRTNLTLENEIRYSIRAIADGHFFLLQKFDDSLIHIKSAEHHYENFQLRLIFLESEFKKMKDIA